MSSKLDEIITRESYVKFDTQTERYEPVKEVKLKSACALRAGPALEA